MALGANPLSMAAPSAGLAIDANGLAGLKAQAGQAPDKALKAAAREFEAMFLNQVLKCMRESLPKDGPFASSANDSYTQMLDRELSKSMAAKGTGLAAVLEKQLARAMAPKVDPNDPKLTAQEKAAATAHSLTPARAAHSLSPAKAAHSLAGKAATRAYALPARAQSGAAPAAPAATPAEASPAPAAKVSSTESQKSFLAKVVDLAKPAAASVGLSPVFVAAQAALESGWGKHEMRDSAGQPAHNLFGVKATGNWQGPTVEVTTTEYVAGVARKVTASFRAYASYAEAFADYARLMVDNPRYANVIKSAGQGVAAFAQGLQRAGYATDPAYAAKLTRVIQDTVKIDRQS